MRGNRKLNNNLERQNIIRKVWSYQRGNQRSCLNEFEFWCLTPLSAIFQLYHGFEEWKKVLVRKTTLKKSIFSLCDNILMHSSTCPQSQYSRYIYIYIYINYCLLFCTRQIHVYSWYVAHHLALNNISL
jgi:hypothetical protein